MRHVASIHVNINVTMSTFVIGETTNTTLHRSKLMFESSVANSLNMKTYLQTAKAWSQCTFHFFDLHSYACECVRAET